MDTELLHGFHGRGHGDGKGVAVGVIGAIKQKYGGTKVGASESIFSYLAEGTGLDLITPPGYLNAISEGADPSAADKATSFNNAMYSCLRSFGYEIRG